MAASSSVCHTTEWSLAAREQRDADLDAHGATTHVQAVRFAPLHLCKYGNLPTVDDTELAERVTRRTKPRKSWPTRARQVDMTDTTDQQVNSPPMWSGNGICAVARLAAALVAFGVLLALVLTGRAVQLMGSTPLRPSVPRRSPLVTRTSSP